MTDKKITPTAGLTLRQALERYGDPVLWQAYRDAAARVPKRAPPRPSSYLGGTSNTSRSDGMDYRRYRQLKTERDSLWRQLVEDFTGRFRAKELVAVGYDFPLRPGANRVVVEADQWQILRPDFRRSEVRGGGRKLIRVRVWPAALVPDLNVIDAEQADDEDKTTLGRPSDIVDMMKEMRRRHAAGKLAKSLAAECRALNAWNNKRNHRKWTYNWRSLQGQLRSIYNELNNKNNDLKSSK